VGGEGKGVFLPETLSSFWGEGRKELVKTKRIFPAFPFRGEPSDTFSQLGGDDWEIMPEERKIPMSALRGMIFSSFEGGDCKFNKTR